ncbi:unnamed protein product [Didymodactylos carnosus]|uniref:Uncharacterized protein n=1 Tax=Didymodactylos carnosus TaxID=1234261 RepID=A0A814XXN0_9BILA|nr:unnamed protein product [Didymodactylos carnosus]CAF3985448.1 unnamed protein product [Didymodactylos carnosus]
MIAFLAEVINLLDTRIVLNHYSNSSYLALEFLLKFLLTAVQWLNSCVATERAAAVLFGIKFDKDISQNVAKYTSLFIILVSVTLAIHDPLHGQVLVEDRRP